MTTKAEDLSKVLARFYAGAKKKDGSQYKVNTMKTIRFSLQRHLLSTHQIDIIDDERFVLANNVFCNVLKKINESGLGSTTHKAEIEPEDLRKLYRSFDVETPAGPLVRACLINYKILTIRWLNNKWWSV